MTNLFTSDFFCQNRNNLKSSQNAVLPIVVTANGLLQRNGDVTFNFRQDSSFWYLTGIEQPDAVLVIDMDMEYIIMPYRSDIMRRFDGDDNLGTISSISGIEEILDYETGWNRLAQRVRGASTIATLLPPSECEKKHGFYLNPARKHLIDRLLSLKPKLEFHNILHNMAELRMLKQRPELEAIQSAIEITGDALLCIYQNRKRYNFENEIEADITKIFKSAGLNHAFSPIVASGKNACTIHYNSNKEAVDKKGLLVLDIGAEVSNYASDITRTFAVNNSTARQRSIYDAVIDVQQFALQEIKTGVLLKDYEDKVEKYMGKKLLELGLIKSYTKSAVRRYYPHSASHFLGLDTHDIGEYSQPLRPGIVLTCEPGIYIPEEGIGVRIEDDVLLTGNGLQILSSKLPKAL